MVLLPTLYTRVTKHAVCFNHDHDHSRNFHKPKITLEFSVLQH